MIRFVLSVMALAAAILAPAAAVAKDDAGVVPLLAAPAALSADAAYILLRTSTAKSGLFPIQHVMLRIPSQQELEAYRTARRAAYDAALPELTRKARDGKVPT